MPRILPGAAASYCYDDHGILTSTTADDGSSMPNLRLLAWQLDALRALLFCCSPREKTAFPAVFFCQFFRCNAPHFQV